MKGWERRRDPPMEYWFAIDTPPPPPSFFSLYTYIFEQINDFFFFLSLSYHLVASSTDSAGEKEKKDFVIVRRGTTHTTPVISAYTAKQWDSLSLVFFSLSLFLDFSAVSVLALYWNYRLPICANDDDTPITRTPIEIEPLAIHSSDNEQQLCWWWPIKKEK